MSMFLLTTAFGSALGIAISPTAVDPKLVWLYVGLAIASFLAGCLFWVCYSRYNAREDEMNALEAESEPPRPVTELGSTFANPRDEKA